MSAVEALPASALGCRRADGAPACRIHRTQVSLRGGQANLRHPEGAGVCVIVPMHPELATGMLASIPRQARLNADELQELR